MSQVSETLWTNWIISLMTINAIYCLIFLSNILYNYINAAAEKKINRIIIYASILYITSWLIRFISSMTTFIDTTSNLNDNHDIANFIICIMIILHPIFFYSLWTYRLYFTFRSSSYKLTATEFGILLICFLVLFIARFIEQTSWVLVIAGYQPIIPFGWFFYCLWIFTAFDVVTRVVLVYFFAHKLFLGVKGQTGSQRCVTDKIELNKRQRKFLVVIRKITLLGTFSALSVRLPMSMIFVPGRTRWILFNSLQSITVFIDLLTISLTFNFNQNMYHIFCRYCDAGCACCCAKIAKRKISDRHSAQIKKVQLELQITHTFSEKSSDVKQV